MKKPPLSVIAVIITLAPMAGSRPKRSRVIGMTTPIAAAMGVVIPMTLERFGRDPAMGASVMITAITDSGGFFIFLGLATIFLM